MKIAMIACGNGLGHVKRLIKICNEIQTRAPDIKISLLCENWQINSIQTWSSIRCLSRHKNVEIRTVSIPVRWDVEQGYYSNWLWNWHTTINAWQLDKFDQVVSDNLIEPLLYTNRITLSGSFLWHDILATAFPENPDILYYKEWAENIMLSKQTVMIANRYFAMPVISQQTDVFKVGIINFNNNNESKQIEALPKKILIAFGNAKHAKSVQEKVKKTILRLNNSDVTILCSHQLYDNISTLSKNVVIYNFNDQNIIKVDLAIVLGGLGTISDCIAGRIPMLFIKNGNPEMDYNLKKISEFGIGMPLEKAMQNKRSPITDMNEYLGMIERCKDFTLHGEVEAANFLLARWGKA